MGILQYVYTVQKEKRPTIVSASTASMQMGNARVKKKVLYNKRKKR
jgi:hypothetical protein